MATRTIGTELVLAGEKEFNDGMKAVNSNLKTLKSDMSRVTAEFDGNADSMEALTAKQKVLRESVDQHQAKVDALRQMYEKQKKLYGENSAQADKYKQQLNNATVALLKEQKALKQTEDALEDVNNDQKQNVKETQKATKETEKAAKEHKSLAKAAEASKKALSGVGKVAGGMGKAVGVAAKASVAGLLAIAAAGAAAIAGVVGWAKEQADAAKAASEAWKPLTASQKQWLAFSKQLDALEGSVGNAKSAIAGILLPMLVDLTTQGSAFLDAFAKDMQEATGDTQRQTQILGQYIAEGARQIISKLPEYVSAGKEIFGGVITGFQEGATDGELAEVGLNLIMEFLDFVVKEAPALADAGLELALQLLNGIEGQDVGESVSLFIQNLLKTLVDSAPELIPAGVRLVLELLKGIAMSYDDVLLGAWDLVVAIKDGVLGGLDVLKEVGPEIIDELISSLKSSDSDVLEWCGEFIENIKNGIIEAWPGVVSFFNDLLEQLWIIKEYTITGIDPSERTASVDGSHFNGLRYVPYDGYLAELHRGEQVLTAQEAEAYRSGKGKGATVNIYPQSLSPAELEAIIKYVDGGLGEGI